MRYMICSLLQELDEHSVPEMLKSSLEQVVLRVKTLNMGSPRDILSLAIDPPKLSGIERAIVNLKEVKNEIKMYFKAKLQANALIFYTYETGWCFDIVNNKS